MENHQAGKNHQRIENRENYKKNLGKKLHLFCERLKDIHNILNCFDRLEGFRLDF